MHAQPTVTLRKSNPKTEIADDGKPPLPQAHTTAASSSPYGRFLELSGGSTNLDFAIAFRRPIPSSEDEPGTCCGAEVTLWLSRARCAGYVRRYVDNPARHESAKTTAPEVSLPGCVRCRCQRAEGNNYNSREAMDFALRVGAQPLSRYVSDGTERRCQRAVLSTYAEGLK